MLEPSSLGGQVVRWQEPRQRKGADEHTCRFMISAVSCICPHSQKDLQMRCDGLNTEKVKDLAIEERERKREREKEREKERERGRERERKRERELERVVNGDRIPRWR